MQPSISSNLKTKDSKEKCPNCENWYKRVALHWNQSSECEYPELTNKQYELCEGMLLGDGSFLQHKGYMQIKMINKTFLEWLTDELGWVASDVKMERKHIDNPPQIKDYEISPSDTHDYYYIQTRPHPKFHRNFSEWYVGSEFVFSEEIKLTPTKLKMWYVSDGSIRHSEGRKTQVSIGLVGGGEKSNRAMSLLRSVGFKVSSDNRCIRISTHQTSDFFDYIGESVPGFERKWAWEDVDEYQRLKDRCERHHRSRTE